ncbi:uncharacterized protein B0H18DRAFT_956917 [Fomitopsis serialis]|uniref:uncharacterized protein n=1 Tax=Fomitopsis serialis TaxID=139415 RepID=UPI0020071EFD|nr:uncharacterized protein B0H18DRAFT_956917 [Neoantrodia serialis]KAH9920786.1 hypothetical protein B0H18DRAFT_956917 [Neoantrodia serialis]
MRWHTTVLKAIFQSLHMSTQAMENPPAHLTYHISTQEDPVKIEADAATLSVLIELLPYCLSDVQWLFKALESIEVTMRAILSSLAAPSTPVNATFIDSKDQTWTEMGYLHPNNSVKGCLVALLPVFMARTPQMPSKLVLSMPLAQGTAMLSLLSARGSAPYSDEWVAKHPPPHLATLGALSHTGRGFQGSGIGSTDTANHRASFTMGKEWCYRLTVWTRYEQLQKLSCAAEFKKVSVGTVCAHRWVAEVANFLCSGISWNNLMFYLHAVSVFDLSDKVGGWKQPCEQSQSLQHQLPSEVPLHFFRRELVWQAMGAHLGWPVYGQDHQMGAMLASSKGTGQVDAVVHQPTIMAQCTWTLNVTRPQAASTAAMNAVMNVMNEFLGSGTTYTISLGPPNPAPPAALNAPAPVPPSPVTLALIITPAPAAPALLAPVVIGPRRCSAAQITAKVEEVLVSGGTLGKLHNVFHEELENHSGRNLRLTLRYLENVCRSRGYDP